MTQEPTKTDLVEVDHDPRVGDVLTDRSCEGEEARKGKHITPRSWY